jgi:competence protein ComEA
MSIDDFEWEGEAEGPRTVYASQVIPPGGSWLSRLRRTVWLEPALKLGGIAALLGVLSGIGVVATSQVKPGMKLPDGSRSLADALAVGWLKPAHSAEPVHSAERRTSGLAQASAAPPVSPSPAPSPPPRPSAGASAPPDASGLTADGRVILNRATAEELTALPGVGKRRAEAIVALRTKLKRFKQPADLLRVKGIGPRGLKRMLPHLVLDAP